MKINYIETFISKDGLVIIPMYETETEVQFQDIAVTSKLFSGKKDSHYIIEKNGVHFLFLGIGKAPDYKTIKTSFRRIASKQRDRKSVV